MLCVHPLLVDVCWGVCMHACVRLCVCGVFIHPNRKHLNCKAIHLFWHSMTSSWVGLQRACSRPSSAGEETVSLPLADCNNKTKEPPGHLGSDLAGGAFPSFSHLRTWEVCERGKSAERYRLLLYVCLVCIVRSCPQTHVSSRWCVSQHLHTHPPTHPLTWHQSFSPHVTSAGSLPDSHVLCKRVHLRTWNIHQRLSLQWVTSVH